MLNSILEKEIHQQLEHLPLGQQRQVLDFARALAAAQARGVAGATLLRFAGTIQSDELKAMAEAIENDCGKVEADGW